MFFANWTSKPQVCLSDPSFNHASGLPTANEKQAASAGRKSGFCGSCMRVYTLFMMGITLQRTPSTCFWAISWDPSRYCGVWLTSKTNPSRRVQRVYRRSDNRARRESISCTWKSTCSTNRHTWCRWHNCGEHNCRHNQIALSSHFLNSTRSSSAVAQTEINTQLTLSTDTREPGIKTGTLSIKRYKTISPCTLYDFIENSLSNVLNRC